MNTETLASCVRCRREIYPVFNAERNMFLQSNTGHRTPAMRFNVDTESWSVHVTYEYTPHYCRYPDLNRVAISEAKIRNDQLREKLEQDGKLIWSLMKADQQEELAEPEKIKCPKCESEPSIMCVSMAKRKEGTPPKFNKRYHEERLHAALKSKGWWISKDYNGSMAVVIIGRLNKKGIK